MKQVYCAKTFAERCRAVRLEKDLGQKEVAKAIGWNRTSLSKFENGRFREKMDFPASRLGHLMDVLEVSADYLLFGDEHKKKLLDRFNKASYENFELAKKEFPRTSFHEEYACEDISQRLKRIRAIMNP